jgi:hypothetical protein
MYIFNTTFNLDLSILEETKDRIENKFIPNILETGLFNKAIFTEVLGQEAPNGKTYSLQLFCPSYSHYNQFKKFHEGFFVNLAKPYNGKLVYFQTLMEIVSVKSN